MAGVHEGCGGGGRFGGGGVAVVCQGIPLRGCSCDSAHGLGSKAAMYQKRNQVNLK